MVAQHTPGPWFYGDEDDDLTGYEYVHIHAGEYGNPNTFANIAEVKGEHGETLSDETRANARLIAAAPALLEALESMIGLLGAVSPLEPENYATSDWHSVLHARAAIALANGEAA